MKTVLFVLLDQFADWESAFLAPALRGGIMPGRPGRHAVRYATPGGVPVRSIGGMTLTPDCDTETLPDDCAGLILVGGMSWATPETERIVPLVREALSHGILVGAICNAASFLAAHGFLNGVRHTGNGLEMLREWGGANYTGGIWNSRANACARSKPTRRSKSPHRTPSTNTDFIRNRWTLSKNTSTIFRNPRRSCCTNSTARPTYGPWRRE